MSASPSEQIVTKIAEENNAGVTALPPLYDTIDPEKLDALIQSLEDGSISFTYAGYEVTVTSEKEVTIADPTVAKHS
ncbi:HalOD1 output domain-containing protein [Halobacterium sp. R2-5]|uniref:HalOD1 output domain-containing protein n=1 Tax=Halobacterium sp. R2-5 TaxID=2715751 RepID=UPI0014209710|nr:HalOD1 output domain-containing protein [Halobacterium sp. R2-5]NIC00981.1 hypothetical protein [Halobacterium sp. R2-5]